MPIVGNVKQVNWGAKAPPETPPPIDPATGITGPAELPEAVIAPEKQPRKGRRRNGPHR